MTQKKTKLEVVEEDTQDDDTPSGESAPEAKAETNGQVDKIDMVKLPFRGFDFQIPKEMDEWETEACLAMNQTDYVLAAKLILGPAQWSMLLSLGSKRKDIREFLTVFADVVVKECIV